jgi:hypothetical protein
LGQSATVDDDESLQLSLFSSNFLRARNEPEATITEDGGEMGAGQGSQSMDGVTISSIPHSRAMH